MNKRILIESLIFALLLMVLIIGWQVVQGYLNTQNLSSEFPSELSTEITIDATVINHPNGNFHIAYWSSPSILFGVNQPFGLDDLLELVGVFLIFSAPYYFIRKYVHKRKTA